LLIGCKSDVNRRQQLGETLTPIMQAWKAKGTACASSAPWDRNCLMAAAEGGGIPTSFLPRGLGPHLV
jgi:hypothetical protein